MTESFLDIDGISHGYSDGEGGIFDISFSMARGEFVVLAGRNGSGKTTFIRHLNGLLKPDKGRIRLHGNDIFKDIIRTRQTVGMVFQDADTQIVGETIFDEVAFGPENLGWPRRRIDEKVAETLNRLDLLRFRDRHPATLSGGEKRRLTIAGILVMDPELIVFDEPFANLDFPATQDLIRQIKAIHREGKTILMATHDVDMVIEHADRLMIMAEGKIAAQGPAGKLAPELGRFGLKPWCACRKIQESDQWPA
ncbi:MAG: energy-coupling factor ABC transporter ATP-binding protein [Desulfobacterales bacterium]|nr:energy-coupling factor ABC transporter ATP-binding protein [Desulfobacterales bacterium]